jgi:hypothetical protein
MVRQGYSAHFKFEATKDRLERVLKKLHPMQNVGNLLLFLTQCAESENVLQYGEN